MKRSQKALDSQKMTEEIRNMLLLALVFEIVVQFTTEAEEVKIEAKCRQDVSLPCNANFNSKDYFSVTWYKNEFGPEEKAQKKQQTGIIRKNLDEKEGKLYKFHRDVSVDEQNRLVLSKVTPIDTGEYECAVGANVGRRNINLIVKLEVPECEPDETTISMTTVDTDKTTSNRENRTDLPLIWSLLGYGAVALTKILLSAIIIWGFHIWTRRKRRW
uniref:Ig-like domain-containing protein n=1 Tax=Neogobius melanostomus TaxID=47308 RepID=A0A8C6UAE4_9GOBI